MLPLQKHPRFASSRHDAFTRGIIFAFIFYIFLQLILIIFKVVKFDDEICGEISTPEEAAPTKCNLLNMGVSYNRHNILSLPGFWPGKSDGFDYPVLIGLNRELVRSRIERNNRDFNDSED